MKTLSSFFILFFSLSCSAEPSISHDSSTVAKLFETFIPGNYKKSELNFKQADFNGDGVNDIVVLFTPKSKPKETSQLKVLTPWIYPNTKPANKYRKSLAVFQSNDGKWWLEKLHVFVLLDTNGVLETPSFELLTISKSNKQYLSHASSLPVKISNDLIIIPTEAGIDTYIYWDKGTYKLYSQKKHHKYA